jgi:hypothetical protein
MTTAYSSLLALIFLFAVSCSGMQKANLTYKFEPGKVTEYLVSTNSSSDITVKDIPEEQAKRLGKNVIKDFIKVDLKSDLNQKIESVQNSAATIFSTHVVKESRITQNGKTSEQKSGQEVSNQIKISPNGELVKPDENSSSNEKEEGNSASSSQIFPQITLPGKETTPGTSWTGDINLPVSMKNQFTLFFLKGKINYKFQKIESFQGVKCALITYEGDLTPELPLAGKRILQIKGAGKLNGKVYFDLAKGEIAQNNKTLKYNTEFGKKPDLKDGRPIPTLITDTSMDAKIERVVKQDGGKTEKRN